MTTTAPLNLQPILDLVGVRYADYGDSVATGFDCFTLCRHVYRLLGEITGDVERWAFPMPPGYDPTAMRIELVDFDDYAALWQPCPPLELGAVFDMQDAGRLHAGVGLGDGRVIHTCRRWGCVLHPIHALRSRIRQTYRLKP